MPPLGSRVLAVHLMANVGNSTPQAMPPSPSPAPLIALLGWDASDALWKLSPTGDNPRPLPRNGLQGESMELGRGLHPTVKEGKHDHRRVISAG